MLGMPYAGWVFDTKGSYQLAFWSFAAALVVALALLQALKLPAEESV